MWVRVPPPAFIPLGETKTMIYFNRDESIKMHKKENGIVINLYELNMEKNYARVIALRSFGERKIHFAHWSMEGGGPLATPYKPLTPDNLSKQ